jgi:hypothetical protein
VVDPCICTGWFRQLNSKSTYLMFLFAVFECFLHVQALTMKAFLFLFLFLVSHCAFSQSYIVKDIKSFGAKGDGKTNDHDAFTKAAAFFNKRAGNGKLTISAGTYLVGKQTFNKNTADKYLFEGGDVLGFINIKNLTIEGQQGHKIKYMDSLRYGAFAKATGKPFLHGKFNFFENTNAAFVGSVIKLTNCTSITISGINLDGNNKGLIVGGVWGDVGIQLPHVGIYIVNSRKVKLLNTTSSHFGLDGLLLQNEKTKENLPDEIVITNSTFEYNCRQGLSWIGGNDLMVTGSKFNHTGKGKFVSAPGAGLDIEAEVGPVANGKFINCEFVNNWGVGMLADSGPSSDCNFINCLFWGTSNWSIWIKKPGFTVINSKIYGSMVHGYDSPTDKDATKFIGCWFEDKPYKGKEPFGGYLIESNFNRRIRFENCTMLAHKKKIFWLETKGDYKPEEKFQIVNCTATYAGDNLPQNDWVCLIRSVTFKNSTFQITHPNATKNNYGFNIYPNEWNVNLGGNKFLLNGRPFYK